MSSHPRTPERNEASACRPYEQFEIATLEAPLLQCSVAKTDMKIQCGANANPATQLSAARGLPSSSRSGLLNATKIEEIITKEAIPKFDDEQAGLQGVGKAVMLCVGERNGYLSQCDGSSAASLATPAENEFSQPISLADYQLDSFMSGDAMQPEDVTCLTNVMSGTNNGSECPLDWRLKGNYGGDRESYGEMGKWEGKFPPFFANCATLGLQDGHQLGELEQGCGPALNETAPEPSCCWLPTLQSCGSLHRSLDRKSSTAADMDVYGKSHPQLSGLLVSSAGNGFDLLPFTHEDKSLGFEGSSKPSIFGSVESNVMLPLGALSSLAHGVVSVPSLDRQGPMSIDENLSSRQGPLSIDGKLSRTSLVSRIGCGGSDRPLSLTRMSVNIARDQNAVDSGNSWVPFRQLTVPEGETTASTTKKRKHSSREDSSADGGSVSKERSEFPSLRTVGTLTRALGLHARGEKAQGPKDRTDLKFLFEKSLKPSDVGNLSRIVLPKRNAERHLPCLLFRHGIPFDCQDYITLEKMTLRYRFWPNNKSRMYVLENTGDFIKRHKLRASDRIAIYKREQDGTYFIRPRKAEDDVEEVEPVESDQIALEQGVEKIVSELSHSIMGSRCGGLSESILTTSVTASVSMEDDLLSCADLSNAFFGNSKDPLFSWSATLEAFDPEFYSFSEVSP